MAGSPLVVSDDPEVVLGPLRMNADERRGLSCSHSVDEFLIVDLASVNISWYVCNVMCVDPRIEEVRWSGSDLWGVSSL